VARDEPLEFVRRNAGAQQTLPGPAAATVRQQDVFVGKVPPAALPAKGAILLEGVEDHAGRGEAAVGRVGLVEKLLRQGNVRGRSALLEAVNQHLLSRGGLQSGGGFRGQDAASHTVLGFGQWGRKGCGIVFRLEGATRQLDAGFLRLHVVVPVVVVWQLLQFRIRITHNCLWNARRLCGLVLASARFAMPVFGTIITAILVIAS